MKYSLTLLFVSLAFTNTVYGQSSIDGSSAGPNFNIGSGTGLDLSKCPPGELEEYAKKIEPSAKKCAEQLGTKVDSDLSNIIDKVCEACPDYIEALSSMDPPSCFDAESKSKVKETMKICDGAATAGSGKSTQDKASVSGSGSDAGAKNSTAPSENPGSSANTLSGAMVATVVTVIAAVNMA